MTIRTLDNIDVEGQRVLVRVDFNVPVVNGEIADATRIIRVVATIRELCHKKARVIILSHFGRPKGKPKDEFSLRHIVKPVAKIVGRPIDFAADCVGSIVEQAVSKLRTGDVLLLENTRFHKGEEENDQQFARDLAVNGDIYVNDAFSAAHRAHASTEGLAHLLPSVAGRALQKELTALDQALGHPQRPVIAIVGGSKVSTKIDLLENLISKVDALVIGGGMANTFLAATGIDVGQSFCEHELANKARSILAKAEQEKCAVILPIDATVAPRLVAGAPWHNFGVEAVPADGMILDVGPQSIERIKSALAEAATLIWNGPLGAFEIAPFDRATLLIAETVAKLTDAGKLISVAGGGDTASALSHAGVFNRLTYVSTAGGAFLEWLEGRKLPGIVALEKNNLLSTVEPID